MCFISLWRSSDCFCVCYIYVSISIPKLYLTYRQVINLWDTLKLLYFAIVKFNNKVCFHIQITLSDNPGEQSAIFTFSSPEATFLLVNTKNRDFWVNPTPRACESRTFHYIWLTENTERKLCACSENPVKPQWSWFLGLNKRSMAITHEQNIFCMKTHLDQNHYLWAIICRSRAVSLANTKRKKFIAW